MAAAAENTKRAKFLSVTFNRSDDSGPLGLQLGQTEKSEVFIRNIGEGKLLSRTLLRVNDKLVSINDKPCSTLGLAAIKDLLRTLKGKITIVVKNDEGDPTLVESEVEKPTIDEPTGFEIGKNEAGYMEITALQNTGLFADSLLAVGDRCVSINGLPCDSSNPSLVQSFIEKTMGYLAVVAQTPDSLAPVKPAVKAPAPAPVVVAKAPAPPPAPAPAPAPVVAPPAPAPVAPPASAPRGGAVPISMTKSGNRWGYDVDKGEAAHMYGYDYEVKPQTVNVATQPAQPPAAPEAKPAATALAPPARPGEPPAASNPAYEAIMSSPPAPAAAKTTTTTTPPDAVRTPASAVPVVATDSPAAPAPAVVAVGPPKKRITRKVKAPSGKLGLIIDTGMEGPKVFQVKPESAMKGRINPGDIITAINGFDTRAMSGAAINALMAKTSRKIRTLTVISEQVTV